MSRSVWITIECPICGAPNTIEETTTVKICGGCGNPFPTHDARRLTRPPTTRPNRPQDGHTPKEPDLCHLGHRAMAWP